MKTRKIVAFLMAGMISAGMLTGCGSSGDTSAQASGQTSRTQLSFIVSHKDEYLSSLDLAVKAAAESQNCELTSTDCADDMDKQIEYVRAAADNGADAILVVLADDMRADEVVEAAGDVKVVFVNRIPQDQSILDENHVYVGSNEDDSGVYQGEILADALQKQGKDHISYLMFQGTEGLVHTTKRTEGVLKTLDAAGITAAAAAERVDCGYHRTKALDQMTVMLAENVDISEVDCIIANNAAMALGVLESLRQNNIDTSDLLIIGIDGTNAGLAAVSDGTMLATVYQNATAQGIAGVKAAVNLAVGAEVNEGIDCEIDNENSNILWIPFEKITVENIEQYL